jgi:heavy metal translocating P-type ATPase
MRHEIASDIPGRLRLRFGRYAFSPGGALAMEAAVSAIAGVAEAKALHRTGSLLVLYGGGEGEKVREQILRAASRFAPADFAGGGELVDSPDDAAFKRTLLRMLAGHFLRRLLPFPLRGACSVYRSLRFFRRAWAFLRQRRLTVETLDAAAVGAALLQGDFSTASSVMLLLGVSSEFERHTMRKTRATLGDSLLLNIDTVWVERGGQEQSIPMRELKAGDLVIVRAGGVIPVDGTVERGEATVNESAMTGEAMPVFKKQGSTVFAGTALAEGRIAVAALTTDSGTRIGKILALISESETQKAAVQSKAERIADKLVPYSFLIAAGVFLATRNLTKALSVLLVDYSCAVKLSTSVAVLSAMREASERGILVKGGRFFDAVAGADTIIFDKTGTLTLAEPEVSGVYPFGGYSRDEALRLAACMEEHFPHSVARAIVKRASDEGLLHAEEHAEVEYIVAHGIATRIRGKRAIIGSRHFVFEDEGVPLTGEGAAFLERASDSAIFLAVGNELAGAIMVDDPPRTEAAEAVSALRAEGFSRIVMLTGDNEAAAWRVCAKIGIDEFYAQVLPADKAEIVRRLKREGAKTVMVGDGINDSPALSEADAAIAMKDASDLAREVADITLLRADLRKLAVLRRISRRLLARINGNFRFIAAFNSAVLLGALTGALAPGASALLHNLSTVGIAASAARPLLERSGEREGAAKGG